MGCLLRAPARGWSQRPSHGPTGGLPRQAGPLVRSYIEMCRREIFLACESSEFGEGFRTRLHLRKSRRRCATRDG
jgi:hypothetical protein